MSRQVVSFALYALAGLIGLFALVYPFVLLSLPTAAGSVAPAQINETPLLTGLLVSICLAALLVDLQGQAASAKIVAALGVMVAATSTLRFIEVAIPGPGAFSPIFVPIILGGYVFGSRFGFLLGAMTLFVSAIITAGVGPWLPYQMFTAGWIGLAAGWLPHFKRPILEIACLVFFAFMAGFIYGLIINLYSWPYLIGDPRTTWEPGVSVIEGVRRYAAYYIATSLVWDAAGAIGNVVLTVALGLPMVKALRRFRGRMRFQVQSP